MGLAINTEAGQETVKHQQEAFDLFQKRFPHIVCRQTPTEGPNAGASVDAMLYKNDVLNGIAEVKTRYVPRTTLENEYENRWMLSLKKIDDARKLSMSLQVPYWGLLYLRPDKTLFYIKLFDPLLNKYTCEYITRKEKTFSPVEQKHKEEMCAFINMKDAYIIEGEN